MREAAQQLEQLEQMLPANAAVPTSGRDGGGDAAGAAEASGLQAQLTNLVRKSRGYRQTTTTVLQPDQKNSSRPGSPVTAAASPLQGGQPLEETRHGQPGSTALKDLARASLAATAAIGEELAKALQNCDALRNELRISGDHRMLAETQLVSVEATKRALCAELEDVAAALTSAVGARDAAEEAAAATQAAMKIQQQAHADEVAVLREEHRRFRAQRDIDIEDARRDARSDLLLFGMTQAAAAGADSAVASRSPRRSTSSAAASGYGSDSDDTADDARYASRSPQGAKTVRRKKKRASEFAEEIQSQLDHDKLTRENAVLQQKLKASEESAVREKAKGEQWLEMIGQLREELAAAERRVER
jgi:hypothetical protein